MFSDISKMHSRYRDVPVRADTGNVYKRVRSSSFSFAFCTALRSCPTSTCQVEWVLEVPTDRVLWSIPFRFATIPARWIKRDTSNTTEIKLLNKTILIRFFSYLIHVTLSVQISLLMLQTSHRGKLSDQRYVLLRPPSDGILM